MLSPVAVAVAGAGAVGVLVVVAGAVVVVVVVVVGVGVEGEVVVGVEGEVLVISWDTETGLIRPGCLAPPMVCLSSCRPGLEPRLIHAGDAKPRLLEWLSGRDILVGHNVAYDCAVVSSEFPELLPYVFEAYKANLVTDTKIRQQLLDIAAGCYRGRMGDGNKWVKYDYTLDACHRRAVGSGLNKDGWRLSYSFFRDVPLDRWEERARDLQARLMAGDLLPQPGMEEGLPEKDRQAILSSDPATVLQYPKDDAVATLTVFEAQEKHAEYLVDQYRQSYAAFCMHLTSCWGISTDPAKVEEIRQATEGELQDITYRLMQTGLVRQDGSRDTKKAALYMTEVCAREGLPLRETAKGGVCLDSDACTSAGDPLLKDYADFTGYRTVLDKDIPMLRSGLVQTSFGLAESGRTTSAKPNLQNMRKAGDVRACFVPRPGYVFAQADYDGLELRTLAQCCMTMFGHSKLAEVLNAGKDPHTELACAILGIPPEEGARRRKDREDKEFDNARQTAKVGHFGIPGGLGPAKLSLFAKKGYGVEITEYRAKQLKEETLEHYPEWREFFAKVNEMDGSVEQLFTKRFRGGCSYTAACNTLFQGLGADCAKAAYCLISEACYVDKASHLFGSRVVAFIHDEFILEVPDDPRAHDAAQELARLMIRGAGTYLPDVPATTEPLLMRYWSKKATPVYENGRLVPWG